MSIQKIARLAGVSVATVSRVLNNSDTVKAKNRERVLQAIKESNYQPNLLARQLRTARSNMILVMVSNIANPFCAEVVKGIEEEAEKNGYRILLCNSGSDLARSTSGLQLLSGKMVDGIITMNAEAFAAVQSGTIKKGDVLGVARIAGIMATKRTSELIPLCHPLPLTKVGIEFRLLPERQAVEALCTVKTSGVTGVEMEALTGVSTALLTIYDMCKAVDKGMELGEIHLVEKTGGKSGHYIRAEGGYV